jgi:hypothetical protein
MPQRGPVLLAREVAGKIRGWPVHRSAGFAGAIWSAFVLRCGNIGPPNGCPLTHAGKIERYTFLAG